MYKAVEIALRETGYLEKATEDALDGREENPGSANFTKYARDLDGTPFFYNGDKQGQPWCDVFVDWCFVQAYGPWRGRLILCQPPVSRGAGCRYSMRYYKVRGRLYQEPKPGDQIFFQQDGNVCHTGLVTDVDEETVYTVEGNTSSEAGMERDGGCVRRKSYPRTSPAIAGYGRPLYELAEKRPAEP